MVSIPHECPIHALSIPYLYTIDAPSSCFSSNLCYNTNTQPIAMSSTVDCKSNYRKKGFLMTNAKSKSINVRILALLMALIVAVLTIGTASLHPTYARGRTKRYSSTRTYRPGLQTKSHYIKYRVTFPIKNAYYRSRGYKYSPAESDHWVKKGHKTIWSKY